MIAWNGSSSRLTNVPNIAPARIRHVASTRLVAGELGLIPDFLVNAIVGTCLPTGLVFPPPGPDSSSAATWPSSPYSRYKTDGFDNVAKLRRMRMTRGNQKC